MTAPTRRAPALLRSVGEHLARLSERLHLDHAASNRDAANYATKTLESAGFRVVEESFPRKTFRTVDRRKWTAIWVAGAAAVAAGTYAVQTYSNILGFFSPRDLPIFAVVAFTFLFDWWLTRPTIDAPSTNIIATRGTPRLWLTAYLDAEVQVPRHKGVEVNFLLTVSVALFIFDPSYWSGRYVYFTGAVLAFVLWTIWRRARSRRPANWALAPVTGAAAVLGAVEQLGADTEIGVLLSRGLDPDKRGIRFGLAGCSPAPAVIVGDVGAPWSIQMYASGRGPRGIGARLKDLANEEGVPLIADRPRTGEDVTVRMFDLEPETAELFRLVFPFRYWQQRVGVGLTRNTDAKLEPVERVAIVSLLLARLAEQKPEDAR